MQVEKNRINADRDGTDIRRTGMSAAGVITITPLFPANDGVVGSVNPLLRASVVHARGRPMDITFAGDGSGEWRDILAYSRVASGGYQSRPRDMNRRGTTYYWRVTASDGKTTVSETFSFNCASVVGPKEQVISHSDCWKYGYVKRGWERGRFFVTTQRGVWSAYDLDRGWYRTYQRLMRRETWGGGPKFGDGGDIGHSFWGYWGGQYHALGASELTGCNGFIAASCRTFEDFRNLVFEHDVKDTGARTLHTHWHEGTTYTFGEDRAWIMAIDFDETQPSRDEDKNWASHQGRGIVKYWQWTKAGGWEEPVIVGTVTNHTGRVALVRHTRDIWYLFVTEGAHGSLDGLGNNNFKSTLKYFKSTDAGKSWGPLQDTGVPAHAIWSSVSFARYGDNYFVFLSAGNDSYTYFTRDLENWTKDCCDHKSRIARGMWMKPHGTLLHQNALLVTVAGDLSYHDEQHGIVVVIPELVSAPAAPTDALPTDGAVLPVGTTTAELSVTVRGSQTYDVSFYLRRKTPDQPVPIEHADGAFVGEDKLRRDGDKASVMVKDLKPGAAYEWYAVVRGALLEYYGGEPDAASDEVWTKTRSFKAGK